MTRRIQQVNELIKRELSQILAKEVDFPEDVLVTVSRVETSLDLKRSRVYISVIPENNILEVFQILKRETHNLHREIRKRLRIKIVPRIRFIEERKTSNAARIEELLEEIKNNG